MTSLKVNFFTILFAFAFFAVACNNATETKAEEKMEEEKTEEKEAPKPKVRPAADLNYSDTAHEFLLAIKLGLDPQPYMDKLANVDETVLASELNSDADRKAFWINVYNGYIQQILKSNPSLYDDRNDFFGKEQVKVAGKMLSFDNIEHGIIRSSTMKLSMGYLDKLFVGDFEKKMRTEKVDPRIHFAINCGAKDCPPVEIFTPATIDAQLDRLAKNYLNKWTDYDADKNLVYTTSLMKWFKGDFDGEDGIVKMLKKYGAIPATANDPDVDFKSYDWTLKLGEFA